LTHETQKDSPEAGATTMTIQETFDKWRMQDEAFSNGHFGTSPDERQIIRDLWLAVKAEALGKPGDKPSSEAQRLAQEAQHMIQESCRTTDSHHAEYFRQDALATVIEAVVKLAGERP
jgi:hypothetical protein